MTTTTLTDRYIDAVTRHVPASGKGEVDAELRASIADEIDGAVAGGADEQGAERSVLERLGNPAHLATKYLDRPLHLVGPRYYAQWRQLLVLLWAALLPVIVLVVFVVLLAIDEFWPALGQTWGIAVNAFVHIGFWVTAAFVVIDRSSAASSDAWSIDELPDEQDPPLTVKDIIGLSVCLALGVGWVIWQQFSTLVLDDTGQRGIPALDPNLWSFWLPYFIAWALAVVVFKVALYRAGRWTLPLAVVNLVVAAVFAIPAIVLALQDRFINPDIITALEARGAQDLEHALYLTVIVVVLSIAGPLLWGVVQAFRRALVHRAARA